METLESIGACPFFLPIRFIFQQGDQLIRRSKLSFAQVWRDDGIDRLEFFARVSAGVDFCGC